MKRNYYVVMAALLLVGLLFVPSSQFAQTNEMARDVVKISDGVTVQMEQAAPGELVTVIVRMKGTADLDPIRGQRQLVFNELRTFAEDSQRSLITDLNALPSSDVGVIRQFWIDNIVLVQATVDVIKNIAARPDVSEIFENFTVTLPPRPEVPEGPDQAPGVIMQQSWDSIDHIGAKNVWTSYGFTGTGVRVGGLDTGVDINHPDIAGKMITNNPADPTYPGGWGEFDSNGNLIPGSVPHDSGEHGTHTTGTAIGGNASGFDIGVAPGASLMHGLVIPGGSGSFAQVAGGMEWIIDPDGNPLTDDGADVVNMSLGATGTHDAMVAPTDNMVAADVFPSFSIGNSGPGSGTTGSPGNVPSAFGVGATDLNDVIASFSSRGPVTWNTAPYFGTWIKPDISAPGVDIYSSVPGGSWEHTGWNGTSMAAPHVTGTVALIRQANPTLLVSDIKLLLAQTALDLGAAGMDNDYGHGRVNCFGAVSAALAGIGTLEGTVYSSAGGTVSGVRVFVTDTGQQVYTDAAGDYSIQLVAGAHTLEYSAFGYDTESVNVNIDADMTHTQDVTLNQLPSGYIAGAVTDETTGDPIVATVNVRYLGDVVRTTTSDALTGAYSVTLPVGVYDVIALPPTPYPRTTRLGIAVAEAVTTPLDFELSPAQVLIVDDDDGDAFETYFENAVETAGRSFLTMTTAPTAAEMATFEAVVWFTGDDYTSTLTASDRTEIAAYLDGGGRMFITGQDIGYDIRNDGPFMVDYLHAAYVQDDVKLGAVLGNPASPVGVGFAFDIKGGTGANNQRYASEVDPVGGAMSALFYNPDVPEASSTGEELVKASGEVGLNGINSSGTAGLTYDDGNHRLVYFSFGFEAIATAGDRAAVMDRVLDWLQGFPEIEHTPLGDTEDTEHPYEVTALITSDYFPLDPPTFAVVYDVGGGHISVPMAPTGNPDEYHGYIPAQPGETEVHYYISASDVEGHTTTHPLGAPAFRHMFEVGADDEPPVLTHIPYSNTNDLQGPYRIAATATDNIGIESVYLVYRRNGGLFHRDKMELEEDGYYAGYIPGPSEVGDVLEYAVLAMDDSYSGLVTRYPESGYRAFEIVEEFVWDFELDDGGFTPGGNAWEWGAPTSGPEYANSGANVWATILDGDYPGDMNATLDVPQITLAADKPYAVFSFWHWYNFENRWDGGNVKISTDGGANFDIITPVGGYDDIARTANEGIPGEPCFTDNEGGYTMELFDLSAYTGQSIILRFHAGSDGIINRDGWYVDDARLRSTDTDDLAPVISDVDVPESTFDTAGPYTVTALVADLLSGIDAVTLYYSSDEGMNWTSVAMTPTGEVNEYEADIPGHGTGTRIQLYVHASDLAGNETVSPVGAPGESYGFSILPSAPNLVLVSSTSFGASLDDYRDALEANGHQADYWNLSGQGSEVLSHLDSYDNIILDERGSMNTSERNAYAAFLASGTIDNKKGFFILARSVGLFSSNRPWVEEYLRAEYVQNSAGYNEITGVANDPIGIGETFILTGTSIDEVQRSNDYPGGVIVYQFTGEGNNAMTYEEYGATLERYGEEWDGVMPHAPISLDAACGMRYNGATYRSVYLTFNLDYIQENFRRAGISDRTLRWLGSPEIVHDPLSDTEDTANPYTATALVYSDDLDPDRVRLTYDVGAGPVIVQMAPTGNPNEWSGDIPAQPLGTTVEYYLSAANTDGNTSFHPPTAPGDKHSFLVDADQVPPVIVHVPANYTADQTGPYVIEAEVTDNVGVDSAELTWRKNGGSETTVAMSNTGGDTYAASMPGPAVLGDIYEYFIEATDVAAVPNLTRDPETGYHSLEIVDFYAWDFEDSDGGFSAGGPDWEWGAPTTGPGGAYSGLNLWATQLGGNYSASSNSTLDLPAVVIPSSNPYSQLSFWQWYYIENFYDGGNVKISTDGGSSWTILTPDIGYPEDAASSGNAGIPGEPCFSGYNYDFWHKATFNLTPYQGQTVIIRLHFGSDSSVQRVGWYVDDVRIESVNDTEGPSFASVDVPGSTFDTAGPYTVTAEVIDGLSGVASVDLNYSTDDGGSWTTVAMTPTGSANEYSGDIPGQASGTRIKHYIEASDNAANTSFSPDGAPAIAYEFGILPSGDFLVLLDGAFHTDPVVFQTAFANMGRSADVIDWDDLGTSGVTVSLLESYETVIIDHSFYFVTAQRDTLSTWLDRNDGTRQQIIWYGDDFSSSSANRPFMEQYTGLAYVKGTTGWNELKSPPGDPIGNGETLITTATSPEELEFSATYPGAEAVFRYAAAGPSRLIYNSEQELRDEYDKYGLEWDPKLWPLAPDGPDSLAAGRYLGPNHASVRFAFQFELVDDISQGTQILDRALDWISAASVTGHGLSATDSKTSEVPDQLELGQNYPNPFNPVTRIKIGVPSGHHEHVSLKVFNVRGQLVATLFEGTRGPGYHTFQWDGLNNRGERVSSGIYFARMLSGKAVMTRKMVLLK